MGKLNIRASWELVNNQYSRNDTNRPRRSMKGDALEIGLARRPLRIEQLGDEVEKSATGPPPAKFAESEAVNIYPAKHCDAQGPAIPPSRHPLELWEWLDLLNGEGNLLEAQGWSSTKYDLEMLGRWARPG